tara:strand:- start:8293 stop:8886 length:594 start_codon:yes stop_codon:yes gene_type:complete
MGDALQEATLVREARDGDRAAFDRLVRAHFGGVYGVLFRMVGNHEDAEDLAQETFVRAWRGLDGFRDEAPLRPWLTRIAVRLAMDHFRARGRGTAVVQLEGLTEMPAMLGGQPATHVSQREFEAAVSRAVDHLPPRLRAALVLRVLEGREYDEVAEALELRPNTVRALVVKARRLLWRHLAPFLESESDSRDGGAIR